MHTETHGSPRKLTEAHGSSRISKKTTFLLFLPLENAFFRVKTRRKSGILELSVRARGLSQIVGRQMSCNKRYLKNSYRYTHGDMYEFVCIWICTYNKMATYRKNEYFQAARKPTEAHGSPRKLTGLQKIYFFVVFTLRKCLFEGQK